MQVNLNNQTGFGQKYRLLVPNTVVAEFADKGYTRRNQVSNIIDSSLIENDVFTNYIGSKIKVFYDKFSKLGFESLAIFTEKDSRQYEKAIMKKPDNGRKIIDRLSRGIKEENTIQINNDIDLAKFIRQKLYPDLEIKSDKVLVSSEGGVKEYYIGG